MRHYGIGTGHQDLQVSMMLNKAMKKYMVNGYLSYPDDSIQKKKAMQAVQLKEVGDLKYKCFPLKEKAFEKQRTFSATEPSIKPPEFTYTGNETEKTYHRGKTEFLHDQLHKAKRTGYKLKQSFATYGSP